MPDSCTCPPYEGDGDPGTNPTCSEHGPIKSVEEGRQIAHRAFGPTLFSEKSIPDQLIHLLAAQYELPIPIVRNIGKGDVWRSVGTDSDIYQISLFAKEPGKAAVPALGWIPVRRLRMIALHLLVAAEKVDDGQA